VLATHSEDTCLSPSRPRKAEQSAGLSQAGRDSQKSFELPQADEVLSAFGIPGPTFADPFLGATNPFAPGTFPFGITHLTLANDLRPPYAQNWNLTLQREFAGKYLVEARYVGTKGTRLPRFIEGNPPFSTRPSRTSTAGGSTPAAAERRALATSSLSDSSPAWQTLLTTPCNGL